MEQEGRVDLIEDELEESLLVDMKLGCVISSSLIDIQTNGVVENLKCRVPEVWWSELLVGRKPVLFE